MRLFTKAEALVPSPLAKETLAKAGACRWRWGDENPQNRP